MDDHDANSANNWNQAAFDARFEWGEQGVARLAAGADVVVIVDVLSFSTCVDVAVGRGAAVLPFRWRNERAVAFAASSSATLAASRRCVSRDQPYSLSPVTLTALQPGNRLVLPSPNGATLSLLAAESCATIFSGCLRSASAVGHAARRLGASVAVIAAGERWPNAGAPLRPAIEDLIGAGAILYAWQPTRPSPEARVAMSAFQSVIDDIPGFLRACGSGRELIESGYPEDVEIAAQLDVSNVAPWLRDGAYVAY